MKYRIFLILAAFMTLCGLPAPASASDSPTEQNVSPVQLIEAGPGDVLLNQGWDYYETAQQDPSLLNRAAGPVKVDLPHTWNTTDPTDTQPGYRRDASWYRKQIQLAPDAGDGRYLLYFESANMTADVYVNGKRAGGHVGGYLGFEIDITSLIDTKGVNEILVRVDNGIDRQIIPSQKSDFVLFGGLTRDVFLRVRPQNYISSLQIDTPAVSAQKATVLATVSVQQHDVSGSPMALELQVHRQGEVVAKSVTGPDRYRASARLLTWQPPPYGS